MEGVLEHVKLPAGFEIKMPDGAEQKLIERLKRRDEAAFNEMIRLYQGRIFGLVFRMLGDRAEAEDLAQEVFITCFKSIDGFRGDSKLSTWLYRVATNHCKNRLKYLGRRGRGMSKEFDEVGDRDAIESASMTTSSTVAGPVESLEAQQTEDMLKRALLELSEEQRQLVVLRDVQHLSYEEMKQVTGLAEGTIKSRLHRARKTLMDKVKQLQGESGDT